MERVGRQNRWLKQMNGALMQLATGLLALAGVCVMAATVVAATAGVLL